MDETPGIQYVSPDLADADAIREQLPLLRHRRTDVSTLCENVSLPPSEE